MPESLRSWAAAAIPPESSAAPATSRHITSHHKTGDQLLNVHGSSSVLAHKKRQRWQSKEPDEFINEDGRCARTVIGWTGRAWRSLASRWRTVLVEFEPTEFEFRFVKTRHDKPTTHPYRRQTRQNVRPADQAVPTG